MKENRDEGAKAAALRLLTFRDRSTHELRVRLERDYPPEEVEKTIDYLQGIGYLDDLRFARGYVQYRNGHRPTGNYLLRLELSSKGVSDSHRTGIECSGGWNMI